MALARIGNITVVKVLSQVIEDLVRGTIIHASVLSVCVYAASCSWLEKSGNRCCCAPPGEFMQLGSKENEDERFKHYLEKTFKKTASLIANSCKAVCTFCLHTNITELVRRLCSCTRCFLLTVCSLGFKVSILVNSDPDIHEIAYQYGRNVGIAFQVSR